MSRPIDWNERLKTLVTGDVGAGDVVAALAGCRPLEGIAQVVGDRVLEADLAHPQQPWVALDLLGALLASVWVAEAAVSLAQSLYEGAVTVSARGAGTLDAAAHRHALALAAIAREIMIDVSRTLADPSAMLPPSRPLQLGIHAGPLRTRAQLDDAGYHKGMSGALQRIRGMTEEALAEAGRRLAAAGSPGWMTEVAGALQGQMTTLAVRQESAQAQSVFGLAQGMSSAGRATLVDEIWSIVEAYVVIGQIARYPGLGAALVRPQGPGQWSTPPVPGNLPVPVSAPTPQALPVSRADATAPSPVWAQLFSTPGDPGTRESARPRLVARRVQQHEVWLLTDTPTHRALRSLGRQDRAGAELQGFWQARGWRLYQDEVTYLANLRALLRQGMVRHILRYRSGPPFAGFYRVAAAQGVILQGTRLAPGVCFAFNHDTGLIELEEPEEPC